MTHRLILIKKPWKKLIHKIEKSDAEVEAEKNRKMRGPHECKTCNKSFTCLSHLRNHEVVHSDERPYRCEVCDKGFRRKYDKNRHVALVHVQKGVEEKAAISNSEFSINNYLVDLLKKTVENQNQINEISELSDPDDPDEPETNTDLPSDDSSTQTSPMTQRETEDDSADSEPVDDSVDDSGDGRRVDNFDQLKTPFYCRHCPKSFPYLSHLRKHEVIHFDEKPFDCTKCSKSFRR